MPIRLLAMEVGLTSGDTLDVRVRLKDGDSTGADTWVEVLGHLSATEGQLSCERANDGRVLVVLARAVAYVAFGGVADGGRTAGELIDAQREPGTERSL